MNAPSRLTLFLSGDVMTGRGVDQILPRSCPPRLYEPFVTSAIDYVEMAERKNGPIPRPVDYGYIWGAGLDVLAERRPHARIVNLETSITTSTDAEPKGINYRMHPGNVPVLAAGGVDCCVLANNHVLDWGRGGLLETLDVLARSGIRTAGAGANLETARAPAVIDAGDLGRILVFAFGATDSGIPRRWAAVGEQPGVHLLPDYSDTTVDRIARAVDEAKQPGDIAVASIHWGPNWGYDVPSPHRHFAHALVDRARIDVVHGHSSHHAKAIEVYQGRPILYGCSDLLNDYEGIRGQEEFRANLVLMYFCTMDAGTGELARLTMTPMEIRNFRLTHPVMADRVWLRDTLDRECRRFGHGVRLEDDALVLDRS